MAWNQLCDAVSVLFPAWERAFAAVALHHKSAVSKELADRIDQFVAEEQSHAKAHEAYNRRRNLMILEMSEFSKTQVIHRRPGHKLWLGTMVSIEYLATCMGRMYLDKFRNEHGRDYKLFKWHAQEEIGHKDLAIDIWDELGYSRKDLRRIALQNQSYVLGFIIKHVINNTDWKSPRNWFSFANWLVWMAWKVLIPMLAIYLPNFHPNNVDDAKYLMPV